MSWVAAGSSHSGALTVEGYSYTWGSNEQGQLGVGIDTMPVKQGSSVAIPRLVELMLGRGICSLNLGYAQSFFGNSEIGFYADTSGELFCLWKAKLRKYEDKLALMANHTWRTEKRAEKIRMQKIQAGMLNEYGTNSNTADLDAVKRK